MRSTFHGLELVKRGLYAQQTGLNTVSQNVANANTPGYSRQVVDMSAFSPLQYPAMSRGTEAGQLGQGVDVTAIRRMRDRFLDMQFRNENGSLGEWEVKRQTLDKIGAVLNEPSDTGLQTVVNQFFNAWQDLSNAPDSITARKVVKQSAIELVDTFHQLAGRLTTLDSDLQQSIDSKTQEVNAKLSLINELNKKIKLVESLGDNANDLRDQRDTLVDQISKLVDLNVTETADGYTITTKAAPPDTVTLLDSGTQTVRGLQTGDKVSGGELKGMLDSQATIRNYLAQLDSLAAGIAAELNRLHESGYTMHDPPQTGISFFVGPFTAADIQVNPQMFTDEKYIVTGSSLDPNTGKVLAGDNSVALQIAQLANAKISFPGSTVVPNGTIEDYFQAVIGQLGVEQRHAEYMEKNQGAIVDQIDNQRSSISNVSIDEEMANMIKFQQAYNASARVITMIDSILDRIINGMGLTR